MAGSDKTKAGLRDKLRHKREARKQRAVERARLGAENSLPRRAHHHLIDKGGRP